MTSPSTSNPSKVAPQAAIKLDFEDGIDRKTIKRLRQRFLAISDQRKARAQALMGPRQQVVLDLLPLIFHLNHPALPGYLDADCPYGLAQFEPDEALLAAASRFSRSFHWRSQGKHPPQLDALFVMGSPGTIAHTPRSDLDAWLCHGADLSPAQLLRLQRKTLAVAAWANSLGVELHIFLVEAAAFRQGQKARDKTSDSDEDCGSAQHYLLLDEFYRTAIHLGGKSPLWWLIPADQEARYQQLAEQLISCRFIKGEDYLDFGPVASIPMSEFLGAGVWQLYKGIDAPWKSLLKLLLIEHYARAEGRDSLCLHFKQAVYQGQGDPDALDPYVMMIRQIESGLEAQGAADRLALARRSFYLKAGLPLSRLEKVDGHWRSRLLQAVVTSFGWQEDQIQRIDQWHLWRVNQVQRERRDIVNALSHSYRFLAKLARDQGVRAAIRPADMLLLGRKLYAAFQRKAGKIDLINPGIAPTLLEENLAFYHSSAMPGPPAAPGWSLFRDIDSASDAAFLMPIKRAASLLELLVWCHCNGLLGVATRLNLQAGATHLTMAELRSIIQVLQLQLPAPIRSASREQLLAESRPCRTLLFINIGIDPLRALSERGLHKLSEQSDSLGFSSLRENLVATIDQVTLNSWQEVSVHRYQSGDTLIQCLKQYLAALAQSPQQLPALGVNCFCSGHAGAIARRVETLFNAVIRHFFSGGAGPHALRYVLQMDQRYFVLQFLDGQPRFVALKDDAALFAHLAMPQNHYSPILFDAHARRDDDALRQVCAASEADRLQVFYQLLGARARLWLLDERGSLCHWEAPFQNVRHLLTPLLRFLARINERRQLRQALQAQTSPDIRLYEVIQQPNGWLLERRNMPFDELPSDCLEVQALGEQLIEGGEISFDLVCDHQEFPAIEYGEQLFEAVAHAIAARRQSAASYPIYLTDLSLPQDLNGMGQERDLQTCEYLRYKLAIERELTRAMAGLKVENP